MSRPRLVLVTTVTASLLLARSALAGIAFSGADPVSVAPKPEYLLAGDVTNDGLTDVIVVSPESKQVDVFVASPDTASHFAAARTLHFGNALGGPALGDVDADGRLDLVVTDALAKVVWVLLGKGDGTFGDPYQIAVPNALVPTSVTIGNFDDSGNPDLAVADGRRGRVFILRSDNGTPPCFTSGGDFAVGSEPRQISTADFNGDGKPDLATLNRRSSGVADVAIVLWKQVTQGLPEFEPATTYSVGDGPNDIVLADFNNDDRPDIAILTQPPGDAAGEIDVLMNQGTGVLSAPTATQAPCPFFTYGAPCRLRTLAAGDFDGNGFADLIVGLPDPRRTRGSAGSTQDAMQAFAGRGDGRFFTGGVFAIQKSPVAMVAGTITGSGKLDLAVVGERTLTLQAFVNASRPGDTPNGDPCLLGDACLSSRCINGVCCTAHCNPDRNEVCNIPGREGTCLPILALPTECTLPDALECDGDPSQPFCVDGWCCDAECIGGRCDPDGSIGICIPGIPIGEACSGDDEECETGFCGSNFVCCREACDAGFCDSAGVCQPLVPQGSPCQDDAECQSTACDAFDGICCNRRCDPASEGCFDGTCGRIDSASPTSTPVLAPTPPGSNPCGSCPSGTTRDNDLCVVAASSNSGCATVDSVSTASTHSIVALLPLALWISRRWQLNRARQRRDQHAR